MTSPRHLTADDVLAHAPSADLLREFLGCDDEMREHAFEMLDAINDPQADEQERVFAAITLAEILYPDPLEDGLGLAEVDAAERAADPEAAAEFDAEEAAAAQAVPSPARAG